ncbi:MAG: glycosyltransferase [Dysgonamonadaceae bacterium]|jgi:glycosyltransferase involved in cell wall biosynthesis|nr:glycosyltransferase [Dysgonamonadaceae bacterium]
MLSICIPVFNHDVRPLTRELKAQADALGVAYEILLIDDRSTDGYRIHNEELAKLKGIRYIELSENIGRSAIRNLLAQKAIHPYLVFMDCDAQIISADYLRNYLTHCAPGVVCCGGRKDVPACPDPHSALRWRYGVEREDLPALRRQMHPNRSFIAFNFLIDKAIFQKVRFDETLDKYGHEDTLFGLMLEDNDIPVSHIDNQLQYSVYDHADVFIRKTEEGLKNLAALQQNYGDRLTASVRLLRAAQRLRLWHLAGAFTLVFRLSRKALLANLKSPHPSLFVFDMYKLGIFLRL